ncbi:MAG TPA: ABC transporter permease [Candidatus Acidoferrum sp.]|nr:ABC transporter permease [Candidatus Acidoferrum sp.]
MFPKLRSSWGTIWNRSRFERGMDDEMRFHLEARMEDLLRSGLSREESRRRAQIEFGCTEAYQVRVRETRNVNWFDDLRQDLRYGWRSLGKTPGLVLVAVLTLALGVGASSWLFSMLRQWVIEAVSFPNPDRLEVLWKLDTRKGWIAPVSAPDFLDWRAQNHVFEDLSAWTSDEFDLTGGAIPERIEGARVTPDFFRTLDVQPAAGRLFSDGEDQPGAAHVAIISYGLWRERFKLELKDTVIKLDGEPYTIVGVVPEEFHFPLMGRANIWVPLIFTDKQRTDRGTGWLNVIGRRKPEVAQAALEPSMSAVAGNMEKEYPDTNTNSGVQINTLSKEIGKHVGDQAIYTAFIVGICIALIACSNLAGIYLARAWTRRREMAVRLALGAKKSRLARQLLSENALLMPAAIGLGLLIANLGGKWTTNTIPFENRGYLPNYGRVDIDTTTVLYAIAVAVLSVLLFSISPVLEGYRVNLTGALKESGNAASAPGGQRLRKLLVICQIVLALMVLVPAGLTSKSLSILLRADPGFRADHVLTAQMNLPTANYATSVQRLNFYNQLLQRLRSLPQVESVGASQHIPFGRTSSWLEFRIDGQPEPAPGEVPSTLITAVTPGFSATLGLSVIGGRFISEEDDSSTLPVIAINQTLAGRLFAHEDPLGRKIRLGRDDAVSYTIVGIVKDVKFFSPGDAPMNESYIAFAQAPSSTMHLVLRTATDPMALASALQSAVWTLDKEQPLSGVQTLETRISNQEAPVRNITEFSVYFALLALFLAAIGIYGVMAYLVESRAREIGIRIACGAERRNVLLLVLTGSLKLAVAGISIGLLGSFGIARLLMSNVFGVNTSNLDVYVISVAVLGTAVFLATLAPVRRATRVDPLTVLRYE